MLWLEANFGQSNNKGPDSRLIVKSVWFSPWNYRDTADVWSGLIGRVIITCLQDEEWNEEFLGHLKRFTVFLGRSFVSLLSRFGFAVGTQGRFSAGVARNLWQMRKVPCARELQYFQTCERWCIRSAGNHFVLPVYRVSIKTIVTCFTILSKSREYSAAVIISGHNSFSAKNG